MNTQNNGPSLAGKVDITANSISLFQENGSTKHVEDILIHKSDSVAEPYDVPIDELVIMLLLCTRLLAKLMIQKWLG